MNNALSIILTALLSSAITLTVLAAMLKLVVLPRLYQWLEEVFLPKLKDHVREGAEDAGDTLLPQFRENVREGFNDAVKDQMGGQIYKDAAKTVTKTMETGLGTFFGKK